MKSFPPIQQKTKGGGSEKKKKKNQKKKKKEMMSDSHGKNRSYVKINLSVLQHLLYKSEQQQQQQ